MNINLPGILCTALTLYWIALIVRIILSWVRTVPEPIQPIANGIHAITDPVLRPVRGLLPPVRVGVAALDLSPIIVFLVLGFIVQPLVCTLTGGPLFQ